MTPKYHVNIYNLVLKDLFFFILDTLTFSKSSLAEGRSAASEGSPICFSILSPLTTVVLTTLLTFRPCTGSTSNSDVLAVPRARGSEKVNWRDDNKMSRENSIFTICNVLHTFLFWLVLSLGRYSLYDIQISFKYDFSLIPIRKFQHVQWSFRTANMVNITSDCQHHH